LVRLLGCTQERVCYVLCRLALDNIQNQDSARRLSQSRYVAQKKLCHQHKGWFLPPPQGFSLIRPDSARMLLCWVRPTHSVHRAFPLFDLSCRFVNQHSPSDCRRLLSQHSESNRRQFPVQDPSAAFPM
jgi:hypothetical protein